VSLYPSICGPTGEMSNFLLEGGYKAMFKFMNAEKQNKKIKQRLILSVSFAGLVTFYKFPDGLLFCKFSSVPM
jgi:hypothetical protein